MDQYSIRMDLLAVVAKSYEEHLGQFVHFSQPMLEMCPTRNALAELRNEGYIEEQTRGVVRFTPSGYMKYQRQILHSTER